MSPIAPGATESVYVIAASDSPLVKIGRSADVPKRLAQIQRMSPAALSVLGTFQGGAQLETALHQTFREHRVHGEWFNLGEEPLATVRSAVVAFAATAAKATPEHWEMAVGSRPASAGDAASLGVAPGELILVITWITEDADGARSRHSEVQKAGWCHWFDAEADFWYPREDGTAYFTKSPQPQFAGRVQ